MTTKAHVKPRKNHCKAKGYVRYIFGSGLEACDDLLSNVSQLFQGYLSVRSGPRLSQGEKYSPSLRDGSREAYPFFPQYSRQVFGDCR